MRPKIRSALKIQPKIHFNVLDSGILYLNLPKQKMTDMEHKSMKRMRILPLCAVAFMAAASLSVLLSGNSSGLNAATNAPARSGDYQINGRVYEQDGIIYDVPSLDDASRDAVVVYFPNRAVIPSYIDVGGARYTVSAIRSKATTTKFDDPNGWVTLPPTLKTCDLSYYVFPVNKYHSGVFYGVKNVRISNLDSFLNMQYFCQDAEMWDGVLNDPNWKLYLNDVELSNYDYVFPEESPMGTSLLNLLGVNSITIPASDTVRTTPVEWRSSQSRPPEQWAKKLQFSADSGYNLGLYDIAADTLVCL